MIVLVVLVAGFDPDRRALLAQTCGVRNPPARSATAAPAGPGDQVFATIALMIWLLVTGVLVNGFFAAANALFAPRDSATTEGVVQTTSTLRSGDRSRWSNGTRWSQGS